MKRLLLSLLFALGAVQAAYGQAAIQQSGPVTSFHLPAWVQNAQVSDGGMPSTPGISAVGVFDGSECPVGVSSQTGPGNSTDPHALFTLCQTNGQTTFKFYGINGEPTPQVYFDIGGTLYPFPFPGGTPIYVEPGASAFAAAHLSQYPQVYLSSYHAGLLGGDGVFTRTTACTDDAGGTCIHDADGTAFTRDNFGFNHVVDARQFGAYSDGVHDDSAAVQAALTAASTHGIPVVSPGGNQTILTSGLTLPSGITLDCGYAGTVANGTGSYRLAAGIRGVLAIPSTATLAPSDNTSIRNCLIERSDGTYAPTIFSPLTLRDSANVVAGFAGTAITLPSGTNGFHLSNSILLGFDVGVATTHGHGLGFDTDTIDANKCLELVGSPDTTPINALRCGPILTRPNVGHWSIDSIVNNGSGACKVVAGIANADANSSVVLQTGDTVFVQDAYTNGGAQSCAAEWPVANVTAVANGVDGCITSTGCQEFTLTGSIFTAQAHTATWTNTPDANGVYWLTNVSGDLTTLAEGMTATFTCGGTATVTRGYLWPAQSRIGFKTAPGCASSTNNNVSFANTAFAHAGGRGVSFAPGVRYQAGIHVNGNAGTSITNSVISEHVPEIDLDREHNFRAANIAIGMIPGVVDDSMVGIYAHNLAHSAYFTNSVLGQHQTKALLAQGGIAGGVVVINGGSITNTHGGKRDVAIEVDSGTVLLSGITGNTSAGLQVADGTNYGAQVDIDPTLPGTGYTIADVLTVTDGTCTTFPQFTVDDVDENGSIIAGHQSLAGVCSVWGANPLATSGGTGTGAYLDLLSATIAAKVQATGLNMPQTVLVQATAGGSSYSGSGNLCATQNCNPGGVVSSQQTVNLNTATAPASQTGTGLAVNGADSTTARIETTTHASAGGFTARRADGTGASPSVVLSGDELGFFNLWGASSSSTFIGPLGTFHCYATQDFTASHGGTKCAIGTTPTNSITMADVMTFWQDGGVTVGSPTGGDEGAGTLNAAGTIYANGTAVATTATANVTGPGSSTSGDVATYADTTGKVLADTAVTGTGNVVKATSPALTTPNLGTPSAATLTNATGLPASTGLTGQVPIANGGTGAATFTSHGILYGNGTGAIQATTECGTGTVVVGTTGAAPSCGTVPLSNILANSAFDIWQEKTTYSLANNTLTYVADRWKAETAGTSSTRTVSRQSGFTGGATYAMRVQRDNASVASGQIFIAAQIYSIQATALQGKTLALSFAWQTGANWTGAGGAPILYAGTGNDETCDPRTGFTTGNTSNAFSGSWAPAASSSGSYSGTVAVPANATELCLSIATGAYTGTAGAADYYDIDNVKLEVNGTPTPYVHPSWQESLIAAQYTYRKTFPQGTNPAQSAGVAGAMCVAGSSTTAGTFGVQWMFGAPMRATPTITTYNPSAANANWRDTTAGADDVVNVDPMSAKSDAGVFIGEQTTAPVLADKYCIHATADARL